MKKRKLIDAALKFASWLPATGTFPSEFRSLVTSALAATKSEPHLGVWKETTTGDRIDYSGLAFWMNRESPEYAREFLQAKRVGPRRWSHQTRTPLRAYLAKEIDALEWLQLIGPLNTDERSRLDNLKASPLGDDPGEEVGLSKLLSEFHDNEVRADGEYKGHVVRVSGTVMEVRKDVTDTIFVVLGNGSELESPQLQCFFEDKFAKEAAALTRGKRITIRGRVDGLALMNVTMSAAEFVP